MARSPGSQESRRGTSCLRRIRRKDAPWTTWRLTSFGGKVNDAIRQRHDGSVLAEFICECGRSSCLVPIILSVEEFDEIRKRPDPFLVARGHWSREMERVVYESDVYELVEVRTARGLPATRDESQAPRPSGLDGLPPADPISPSAPSRPARPRV